MRAIINVATGAHYVKGQMRMLQAFPIGIVGCYRDCLPDGSPSHSDVPYAFKAFALAEAAPHTDTLLWCDSCIVPGPRPLNDLWEKIERDGVWFANNGYSNYEWTADSAYPDLFPVVRKDLTPDGMDAARATNRTISHVVATAFGISLRHRKGKEFLKEYVRLAKTKAFCGPWANADYLGDGWPRAVNPPRLMPCGPAEVRGHRHDQTAASVIAWRLGVELTSCPEWFAYKGGETADTCLIADGNY